MRPYGLLVILLFIFIHKYWLWHTNIYEKKLEFSHLHGFEQFPDIRGINETKNSIFFS